MTTDSHTRLFGASNDGHGVIGTAAYVVTHYIIDGPNGYSYEVNRLIRGRQKQLLVTVHGPIKFALVGHDFYIRDDEGKTQKLIFVERVLRTTQP
ncbi:MAG TPA: hypothetical protein VG714_07910 [Acidobacteriaceae bacterium]|nr:hypothetical protein [Acidobacteriaceae bacterium]